METVTAKGASGAIYTFTTFSMTDSWNPVPVIYMFARRDIGNWFAAYIGETENAQSRFCLHERWNEALRSHRVTHVLALVVHNTEERKRAERDLIQSHCPPMNVQHQPIGLLGSLLRA